jgi:hypothetical protein
VKLAVRGTGDIGRELAELLKGRWRLGRRNRARGEPRELIRVYDASILGRQADGCARVLARK